MDLVACLPPELQTPTSTITKIAAGLSGAGVYKVEAGGRRYVLKIAAETESPARRQHCVATLQAAATAGLAPEVVHVDPARRAVVSAFVADRSFPAYLGDPRTRDAAIEKLGRTLRRVHDLPIPAGVPAGDPRHLLARLRDQLAGFATPAFVGATVAAMLAEEPPPAERAVVLSHNDVNPTNLVFDGERVLLLDWDAAWPGDPFIDLATVATFFRLDDATCRRLVAAHDAAPETELTPRFAYSRRLVGTVCGSAFLLLARQAGHPGGADDALDLGGLYQRLRAGALMISTPEGKWAFGLALIKARAMQLAG